MTAPRVGCDVDADREFLAAEHLAAAERVGGDDYTTAVDQLARYLDSPPEPTTDDPEDETR